MQWTPRNYMNDAIDFVLSRAGCGLLLDPGLGKTSITLTAIELLKSAGQVRKVLVLAPLLVAKTVWAAEAAKWDHLKSLKVVDLTGKTSERRQELLAGPGDVFVINYDMLAKLIKELPRDQFDMLVCDESTKMKDTQTQRFKALKGWIPTFKRRLILTGTPVPNGLQDLFGQMLIVDNGVALGRYITHFRSRFMHQRPGNAYEWFLNRGAAEQIYELVKGKLMRMAAKDHLAMPELIDNFISVQLRPSAMAEYKRLEKDFMLALEEGTVVAANAAVLGGKLRQFANGALYTEPQTMVNGRRKFEVMHQAKIDALLELFEEMQGRPLLLGYEFQSDIDRILEASPGVVDLGRIPAARVQDTILDFNAGKIPVLAAHPASAGHGLNLQAACRDVCWFGIPWNLEHYLQFIGRVWRQGQAAPVVVVHHLYAAGTKDEEVVKVLESKERTQDAFNNAITKK